MSAVDGVDYSVEVDAQSPGSDVTGNIVSEALVQAGTTPTAVTLVSVGEDNFEVSFLPSGAAAYDVVVVDPTSSTPLEFNETVNSLMATGLKPGVTVR